MSDLDIESDIANAFNGLMRLQRMIILANFAVKGETFVLRILTGKKHPQIKLQRLRKV